MFKDGRIALGDRSVSYIGIVKLGTMYNNYSSVIMTVARATTWYVDINTLLSKYLLETTLCISSACVYGRPG